MEANVVDHSSMWSLVSNASIVVQLVMLTLLAASVTSWVMIFQRSTMLRAGRRALESFEERFWSGIDLSKLYRQAGSNPDPDSGVEQIFRAGFKEFSRLRQQPGVDPEQCRADRRESARIAAGGQSGGKPGGARIGDSSQPADPGAGAGGQRWPGDCLLATPRQAHRCGRLRLLSAAARHPLAARAAFAGPHAVW